MRTLSAVVLAFGLVACGGSSKPAAQDPDPATETTDENLPDDSNMPVENEHCCCDYVPTPDEDTDYLSEDHLFADMSVGECDEAGGVCEEDYASCGE